MPEVRYQYLRPRQIIERRKACPVAYVPIGTLEWHGYHNPLGADTLQAEGVAIACAERGGGLAFPPLYYGENRLQSLMESNPDHRDAIANAMELDPKNFEPSAFPFSETDQMLSYGRLLLHILAELETLGFKLGVIVAGHYPLISHAQSAVLMHNRRSQAGRPNRMLAWAFLDYLFLQGRYDCAGDHAAGWETSHLLALHPETVDLNELPARGEPLVGVGGKMAPQDSTAAFGQETIDATVDLALKEVEHRLKNTDVYFKHGAALKEGLWRSAT
ncbi:MAG: creatininase family protein [Planctomycetota bacterium]